MLIARLIDAMMIDAAFHGRTWRDVHNGQSYVIGLAGHRIFAEDVRKARRFSRTGVTRSELRDRWRKGFRRIRLVKSKGRIRPEYRRS